MKRSLNKSDLIMHVDKNNNHGNKIPMVLVTLYSKGSGPLPTNKKLLCQYFKATDKYFI